jgi:glycosyltransferase involved in cell wall biosynthesis
MPELITALVLTHNEQRHISRCIKSLQGVVDQIVVVDSGSTDLTLELCQKAGVEVLANPWKNYSTQFNWGLDNGNIRGDWVLRIDADEYLTEPLRQSIKRELCGGLVSSAVSGLYIRRIMIFGGRAIRWGGCGDLYMLRLFRYGQGRCEERWMDEHITLNSGKTKRLCGELIDENLNNIGWWIAKHNNYATREAIDLLNIRYRFENHTPEASIVGSSQVSRKRWLKERIYARMPIGFRAILYFGIRYIVQLGFLDGKPGLLFHFLQGFWYRLLVDLKVREIETLSAATNRSIEVVIEVEYGFRVGASRTPSI